MTSTTKVLVFALVVLFVAGCGSAAHPAPARFVDAGRVVIQVEGRGVVTSSGGDVRCRSGAVEGCQVDWSASGPHVLQAEPAPGWRFVGWEVARADASGAPDPGFLAPMGDTTRLYRARFVRDYQRPPSDTPAVGPRAVASAGPPESSR